MSTAVCPSVIHLCFLRLTRLTDLLEPAAGPNNFIVTNLPVMLTITPDILAGENKDQKGGCDQLLATYRGQDITKRFNLEIDMANDMPALEEMLTGASAIVDGAGNPIGNQFPVPCGTQQPYACLEAWQDLWDCDHQPSSPYPYRRWVFPATRWVRAPETAQNDFGLPKFTGFSVGNSNWGLGIYDDLPEACQPNGMKFFDTTLPDIVDCSYQTQSLT